MHQHVWYKKLRQLNSKLRVCQFENSKHLPGIYYVDEREGIVDICATDIQWVPALPQFDSRGFLVKSGYRRVVHTLLQLKLTTRDQVREVFPSFFESTYPAPTKVQSRSLQQHWSAMMKDERRHQAILDDAIAVDVSDPLIDKMHQMELDNNARRGTSTLNGDQYVELAGDVKQKMTDDQLQNLDEAKFNYDKAVGKRKTII